MRRPLAALAVVLSIVAGAAVGFSGARVAVARLAADMQVHAGWIDGSPDAALPVLLSRALHVLRDPAGFPDDTIRTFETATDADGRALVGRSTYVLRFAAGGQQTTEAFWGLSTSAADARPAGDAQASLTSRKADLRRNADGSLDVLVQASPPDDPAANWLPAPPDAFRLFLRLYAPKSGTGTWRPPALVRRETSA